MKNRIAFLLLMTAIVSLSYSQTKLHLYDLTLDHRENPIGVDNLTPSFSWKIKSSNRNVLQTRYELRVAANQNDLKKAKNLIWYREMDSEQSLHIVYGGPKLQSKKTYYWQVRIRDNQGNSSAWSEVQRWEMGLVDPHNWSARWIEPGRVTDGKVGPPPVFFKDFNIPSNIQSARLYVTSHGIYEVMLNGQNISENLFNPGWTSYNKRLQYQTYDVTALLKKGKNESLVTVGDGWYRGFLEWNRKRNFYGKEVALLYQLEIELTDGTKLTINSDSTWRSSFDGPIRFSDIYNGETIDTRIGNDVTSIKWNDGVRMMDYGFDHLVAQQGPAVKRHEHLKAISIVESKKGTRIVDFGQNLVGWVRIHVKGNKGDTLVLHHAEVLDKDGDLYTQNLRTAAQENKFILNGEDQWIEPSFTFQGFRYIRLSGAASRYVGKENLTAVAIYSDMKPTGSFTSSNDLVNQLQSNIQWGQKSNFLDVPTDCPQRDERLGWTGDAQVFFNTAAYNMDVDLFFRKWLNDVQADQYDNGNVPAVVPMTTRKVNDGSAGWADVATIIPWHHFIVYGDTSLLKHQYQSMKKWVDFIKSESEEDLWKRTAHYGDWLFYTMDNDRDGKAALTDKTLIAQAFYAASTQNLIHAANVLDYKEDTDRYTELLSRIKAAFLREFVTPSGRLVSSSQTAYVLALNFDLLPEDMRVQAAQRLVDNIKQYNYHITTGFLGTPYISHVLSRFGYHDVAFKLLLQETYPSWLYPVKKGATTIWERWDGIKNNGDFQTASMNSFNHYAYGAVGDWMYKVILGMRPDDSAPAYKHVYITPHIGGDITYAKGSLQTKYGLVVSDWKVENKTMHLRVSIPANVRATITFPSSLGVNILEGKKVLTSRTAIQVMPSAGGDMLCEVGSGEYDFKYVLNGSGD